MPIFPVAPDQTIARMWSNGVWGGIRKPRMAMLWQLMSLALSC